MMILILFYSLFAGLNPLFAQHVGDDNYLKTPSDIEQLVVVQTVSTSQKTFVIRLGRGEHITPGFRGLFSTEKLSIVGECIEASREYSLWKPWEPNANIPFKKGQIITFNNNLDSVWNKIPELQETLEEKKRALLYVPKPYWIFRYSVSRTISESTTETDAERVPKRKAQQMELYYNKHLYRRLDWGAGVRVDQETATLEDPNLTMPTTRYLGVGEITFHFDKLKKTMNNLYASIGMGLGMSTTQVDSAISRGSSVVLPIVRVGFLTNIRETHDSSWSLLTEVVGEAIADKQEFADGDKQNTNITNVKLAIGLRF